MNVDRLNARDLRNLFKRRCEHGHNFAEHPHCYISHDTERIGFIDIECSNLKADWGILLTYSILSQDGKLYKDVLTKDDIRKWGKEAKDDTRLLRNLIRDMNNFDRLVGHYSCRFDMPFIRTRAMICGVDFPGYGVYTQTDTWMILRNKFNLSRNSLENGTRVLLGKTDKTHLTPALMLNCLRGEPWALKEMLAHNIFDVKDTRKLFNTISPFVKINNTSI